MNAYFNIGIFLTLIILITIYILDTLYKTKYKNISLLFSFFEKYKCIPLLIFIFCLCIFWLYNKHVFVVYNNYSYLADSFLKGRLDVPDMPLYLESVEFKGYRYMHFAPGPSLLVLPFVAALGINGFNTAYLCIVLGALNAMFFYLFLTNLTMFNLNERLWFTAFLVFGTVHFYLTSLGHSWHLGHISTLFFLLIAMYLITIHDSTKTILKIKKSNIITFFAGFFFALAVTCRMVTLLSGIFFVGYIIIKKEKKVRDLLLFAAGAVIPGSLYMLYNYVRFETIMDLGYSLTFLKDKFRLVYDELQNVAPKLQYDFFKTLQSEYGGPLQLKFAKYNLYSIFLMIPEFTKNYPYVIPTLAGVSITFTSPALYFALNAKWKKPFAWILLITVIATSIPFILNYGNGMSQFGMRYSMDFTPFLLILACSGMKPLNNIKKIILLYCIFINAWGTLYFNAFYI